MASAIIYDVEGKQTRFELDPVTVLVRLAIEKLGSANALAEKLGVTKVAVSQWKLGTNRPSQSNLRRLAGLVGHRWKSVA